MSEEQHGSEENGGIRINKFLASCGIDSRRVADRLIGEGRVEVNGKVIDTPGMRVTEKDFVKVDGRHMTPMEEVVVLLNKPRGYVCSREAQGAIGTVYDLLPPRLRHLNYVGRLDADSEGLLIMTNKGELTQVLSHPTGGIEKEYWVTVDQNFDNSVLMQFLRGVRIPEGNAKAKYVCRASARRACIVLEQGLKRQVRQMFQCLGLRVRKLVRVRIGSLWGGDLEPGGWKFLDDADVALSLKNPPRQRKYLGASQLVAGGGAKGEQGGRGVDSDEDYVFNPEYSDKSNGTSSSGSMESYMYSENSYGGEKEPTAVWNNRVKENIHPAMQNLTPITPTDELRMYANDTDITEMIGNLSWKNSIYELATTMSFDIAKSDATYLKDLMYTPQVGDIIRMVTNAEIFRGVITKADDGDKNSNKYTIADLGWYLNKTSQTYQFKNISAANAIKEICNDLSISIVMLPELTANIKQIYFDKTVSDILKDILEKCGGNYNFDFVPEGLRIYKIGDLTAYPEFQVASNVRQEYSIDYRGNVSHSISIEDMYNSIKITSEKDNVYKELMVLQNRDLIDKYGFLQKIVKIDTEKENADTVAKRELNENAKVNETFSLEIVEKYDSYTRAGEVISVDGVKYAIESTNHSYKDGWHFDKLELSKLE